MAARGWSLGAALARRFDALPVSPHGVGRRLLDRTSAQRQRGAGKDVQDPWWTPAALRLYDLRTAAALESVRSLAQRLARGWSDDDVADLYDLLPATVGAQLLVLAERADQRIPDPYDPDHSAVAAFAAQLRMHGRVLVTRGDPEGECDRTSRAWHDVFTTRGHDPVLESRLAEARDRASADASRAVHASLVWVADHLDELWD